MNNLKVAERGPYETVGLSFLFLLSFILISCTGGGPRDPASSQEDASAEKLFFSGREYSSFIIVKPKVDFLFLWDNSSSFLYNSEATKDAFYGTISRISQEFDYRIIISPLIPKQKDLSESYITSESSENVPVYLLPRWHSLDEGYLASFDITDSGALEAGISRAYELTSLGYEKGIFRPNANMIIVLLSNGDDNSWGGYSGPLRENYLSTWTQEFLKLKSSKNLKNFKFLSVVPHTICKGSKPGTTYKMMSAKLYTLQQKSFFSNAVSQEAEPDSFDFCKIESFFRVFDWIKAAIKPIIIPYTYNYWPITTNEKGKYDKNPNNFKVTIKNSNGEVVRTIPFALDNGYSFVDGYQTLNIIECPSHPEISCDSPKAKVLVTGFFIKLNGSAKVTFPNYLEINSQTEDEKEGILAICKNYKNQNWQRFTQKPLQQYDQEFMETCYAHSWANFLDYYRAVTLKQDLKQTGRIDPIHLAYLYNVNDPITKSVSFFIGESVLDGARTVDFTLTTPNWICKEKVIDELLSPYVLNKALIRAAEKFRLSGQMNKKGTSSTQLPNLFGSSREIKLTTTELASIVNAAFRGYGQIEEIEKSGDTANFNLKLEEDFKKLIVLSLREEKNFPIDMINFKALHKKLLPFLESKVEINFWKDFFRPCELVENQIPLPMPKLTIVQVDKSNPNLTKLLNAISRDKVLLLNYNSKIFIKPSKKIKDLAERVLGSDHMSVLVGMRKRGEECQVLLKNSWGNSCRGYDIQENCERDSTGREEGIWIPAEQLLRYTSEYGYIED